MRLCTNVGILAKVTAQYFFYKVFFMYLLYILCIGSCHCYWNNAEEMFMFVFQLTCWSYWNRRGKKHSGLSPARLNPTNARM